ncbi:MAG: L,D-transpeptidase [Nanoarchaeota archaeon]
MALKKLLLAIPLIAGCYGTNSFDSGIKQWNDAFEAVSAKEQNTAEEQPVEAFVQEPITVEQIIEEQIPQEPIEEPVPEETPYVPAIERKLVSQRVVVNIPEYKLWLYNTYSDGNTEVDFETTIGVGRGYLYAPCPRGSYCTPPFTPIGEGWLNAKVWAMKIRYHKGPKAGQVVRWNNGFDEDSNFRRERIDYPNVMRGITTRVNALQRDGGTRLMTNYVLHTTYDEFTVGMPASGGCARLRKQDMLDLYERIAPEKKDGLIPGRVEIEFLYDVVQLDENNMLHLHANIYDRNIDWLTEIKHDMAERGFSCTLDEYALQYMINEQDAEFDRVQREIRTIYIKDADKNYVSRALKARLHANWDLQDFCQEESDRLSAL